MLRKAFTLIELLVVIAIIAILAAILFPVFAQAKAAAKKTVVLSNTKQAATAMLMYANDYDDTSLKLGGGWFDVNGNKHTLDFSDQLFPYTKSVDLLLDPSRNDFDSGCTPGTITSRSEPNCRYIGFGYNWGPIKRRGGGMLLRQIADTNYNGDPKSEAGSTVLPGISMTSIQNPGDMFTFSISYDTIRITMTSSFLQCTFNGTKQSDERYGGQWPTAYADGHAKSMKWKGGFGSPGDEGNRFAVPSDTSKMLGYCADPSFVLDATQANGTPDGNLFPSGGKCSDLPAYFAAFPTAPYSSSASTPTYLP